MKRLAAVLLVLLLSAAPPPARAADRVVLLHGIAWNSGIMQPLADALGAAGYSTLNIDYPSRSMTVEELADHVAASIAAFNAGETGRLHFVGHSMGGLVIRAYIAKYRPQNLGRIVMLGTPNGGSQVADFMGEWWAYKKFFGPAGGQLLTSRANPAVDYDVGVIAGDVFIDPVSALIIGEENDGKVSVAATHVPGEKDHIVLPAPHTLMPALPGVIRQVLWFIKKGQFSR